MTEVELRNRIALEAGVLTNPYWQGKRITNKINEAQRWLQQKLIKQGFKNWRKYADASATVGVETHLNMLVMTAPLPADRLIDQPVQIRSGANSSGDLKYKVIPEHDPDIIDEIVDNPILKPTADDPICWMIDEKVYIHPAPDDDTVRFSYVKVVPDLVYDNDSTQSEIPNSHIEIVIERCVMQIKSSLGDENVKQAKLNEIDKQLSIKYQLDRAVSVTDEKGHIS